MLQCQLSSMLLLLCHYKKLINVINEFPICFSCKRENKKLVNQRKSFNNNKDEIYWFLCSVLFFIYKEFNFETYLTHVS